MSKLIRRMLRLMQILVLMMLPVLVAGRGFEICDARCKMEHAHCERCEERVHEVEDAAEHFCEHHHRHESVRLLLDVGLLPERVYAPSEKNEVIGGSPEAAVVLVAVSLADEIVVTSRRKLLPGRCHLRPMRC